jgi:hypothetical protein
MIRTRCRFQGDFGAKFEVGRCSRLCASTLDERNVDQVGDGNDDESSVKSQKNKDRDVDISGGASGCPMHNMDSSSVREVAQKPDLADGSNFEGMRTMTGGLEAKRGLIGNLN